MRKNGDYVPGAYERNLAVNRSNEYTHELRIFRPSLRFTTVLAYTEFVHCLFSYAQVMTANDALKNNALTSFAPLLVIVPLPQRIPLSPVEEKKSDGYYGERQDQTVYATYPPVLRALMSPDLHVQRAVRESAKAIQQEAAVTDGAVDMPGSEVSSESLQIGRGMPHTEHVGRDGVEYSKSLLGDNQRRTRGIGNSFVVGAARLFNDFAATG